eukprot:scaffold8485_cov110-Isochrysis_galbana.AAC.5
MGSVHVEQGQARPAGEQRRRAQQRLRQHSRPGGRGAELDHGWAGSAGGRGRAGLAADRGSGGGAESGELLRGGGGGVQAVVWEERGEEWVEQGQQWRGALGRLGRGEGVDQVPE